LIYTDFFYQKKPTALLTWIIQPSTQTQSYPHPQCHAQAHPIQKQTQPTSRQQQYLLRKRRRLTRDSYPVIPLPHNNNNNRTTNEEKCAIDFGAKGAAFSL
jgi:hypothetical protein